MSGFRSNTTRSLTTRGENSVEPYSMKDGFFSPLPKGEESEEEQWLRDPEEFPPLALLSEIIKIAEESDLVRILSSGTEFFRSRPCKRAKPYQTACELGPPPWDEALQSNRMNPPGIPMMYGAETEEIAVREARSSRVVVGKFQLEREARLLDIADLLAIPGIFSGVGRRTRLGLIFMHAFAKEIARPVERPTAYTSNISLRRSSPNLFAMPRSMTVLLTVSAIQAP